MTILAALFWSFCSLLIALMPATPHTGQLYLKYGSTKLLYIFCTVTMGRYFLEKRNIPKPRETFFVTAEICSSQLKCLSTITPRYLIFSTMETFASPTTKGGFATLSSFISFSRFLLPTTRLCVLATFRDNLLP